MKPEEYLYKIAQQLDKWAIETKTGGWSTHQVAPMRKLSLEIYSYLGRYGFEKNPPKPKDNTDEKIENLQKQIDDLSKMLSIAHEAMSGKGNTENG